MAAADSLGRVALVDASLCIILRLWKVGAATGRQLAAGATPGAEGGAMSASVIAARVAENVSSAATAVLSVTRAVANAPRMGLPSWRGTPDPSVVQALGKLVTTAKVQTGVALSPEERQAADYGVPATLACQVVDAPRRADQL
eukprot:jgi/Mesen1/3208/ME001855S02388